MIWQNEFSTIPSTMPTPNPNLLKGLPLADYEIFLDDERMPCSAMFDAVIVRDFWAFKRTIVERGIPKYVSFDHDLGFSKHTGMDCAMFLIAMMFDYKPSNVEDFQYYVHSQNPVGAENIRCFMENHLREIIENE